MTGMDDAAAEIEALRALTDLATLTAKREHRCARDWLLSELKEAQSGGRARPAGVLRERAKAAGWSWSAVERARRQLEVVEVRRSVSCWRLPLGSER